MTNKRALKLYPKIKKLKQEFRNKTRQITRLEKQLSELDYVIDKLDQVRDIYNGVCLTGWDWNNVNYDVRALDERIGRKARVWQNVNHKGEWRAELCIRGTGYHPSDWHQEAYIIGKTKEEILIIAKDWVACGKLPPRAEG